MRITILMMIALFLVFQSGLAIAGDGGKGGSVGNGGETAVGPEFTAIAYQLVQLLPEEIELLPVIQETKIIATDARLSLGDGVELDAMNFPAEKKILVNGGRWVRLDCKRKYTLVLHEIFGISGIESGQNYSKSEPMIERLFQSSNTPSCQLVIDSNVAYRLIQIPKNWTGPLMMRINIQSSFQQDTLPFVGSVEAGLFHKSFEHQQVILPTQFLNVHSFEKSFPVLSEVRNVDHTVDAVHVQLSSMGLTRNMSIVVYPLLQPSEFREIKFTNILDISSFYLYLVLSE